MNIIASDNTPSVLFNTNEGLLEIAGKSFSEDIHDFYEPVIEAANEYIKQPCPKTIVKINIEYMNTITTKYLLQIFKVLEKIKGISDTSIHWYYEEDDDDMITVGEDLQLLVDLPFSLELIER